MRIAKRIFLSRLIIATFLFCSASASAQNAPVTINADVNSNRRPINPNIYGVAHATTAQLNDLNSPLNRNGGNKWRRIPPSNKPGPSTWLTAGEATPTAVCAITFSTMNQASGTPPIATSIPPGRRWMRSKTRSSTSPAKSKPSIRQR